MRHHQSLLDKCRNVAEEISHCGTYDFQGQRIARIEVNELLPIVRSTGKILICQQILAGGFRQARESKHTHSINEWTSLERPKSKMEEVFS
jgi:hypothetical protein